MAALVQSFPSPTSTMTMLQSRPTSSEAFPNGSQGQQHQRSPQIPKNIYNTSVGGMAAGNYRGHTSTSPVSPYAFASSPVMQGANPLRSHPTAMPHPRLENRTASAPPVPMLYPASTQNGANSAWPRQPSVNSVSGSMPSMNAQAPLQSNTSKDDNSVSSVSRTQPNSRPLSSIDMNPPSTQVPSYANVAKSSPDRYRRNHRRAETSSPSATPVPSQGGSAVPSGSGMATVGHLYTHPTQSSSTPTLSPYPSYRGAQPVNPQNSEYITPNAQPRPASKDDMTLQRQSSSELAKRYRRRSISSLEAKEFTVPQSEQTVQIPAKPKTYAAMLAAPAPPTPVERKEVRNTPTFERPTSSHGRAESNDSVHSGQSSSKTFSNKRGPEISTTPTAQQATSVAKNDAKIVSVPPRGSSDANKRLTNPSPLSKPMSMSPVLPSANEVPSPAPAASPANAAHPAIPESPAAQQLAALSKKDGKKEGKSSRLRRAFSFGSSAELRKASAENSASNNASHERAKLRKDRYHDEEEAQQAAIVQQQEASGLGEGIYSGQGNFFTGSTDNLSISSTASSASVMIRKMGKGVKKGSRSLVGLFRPKSVVGVPAADSAVPEPSLAQVSMVTVEAEREKVNVNPNPHDQAGGGTGFPKLERNSMDAAANVTQEHIHSFSDRDSVRGRRSIVGGERERAEVLAAVKKGILKRTGTGSGNSSPVARPVDTSNPEFNLPNIPRFNESPNASGPGTPTDEQPARAGHGRTDSVHIEGEEYFLSLQNFASGQSTSMPGTPRSLARNISFNPRIQFHDTWPSGDYDRRGEIATCNRLTPMLAQQIKEELNTFKMEMDVHADSKVYTHFF